MGPWKAVTLVLEIKGLKVEEFSIPSRPSSFFLSFRDPGVQLCGFHVQTKLGQLFHLGR